MRHARLYAGHPRFLWLKNVDGRDKPGHDEPNIRLAPVVGEAGQRERARRVRGANLDAHPPRKIQAATPDLTRFFPCHRRERDFATMVSRNRARLAERPLTPRQVARRRHHGREIMARGRHSFFHSFPMHTPSDWTFWLSVVLVVLAVISTLAFIPVISPNAFWVAVIGYVILVVGCTVKTA
jgi:hypothetical protein